MRHRVRLAAVAAATALGLLAAVPSQAALDPLALCHKTVIKSLEKFKDVAAFLAEDLKKLKAGA